MEIQTNFTQYCKRIRESHPLIHHITNMVTMTDCANMTLAIGASPIMADCPDEVHEMTGLSRALVLNMGTISRDGAEAMKRASFVATGQNIPTIFDPVGVGATVFRKQLADELLKEKRISIVKGNASEIRTLAGIHSQGKGVDSGDGMENMGEIACSLSQEIGAVVAVTGPVDIVTDGRRLVTLRHGHPMLARVTGTGCMTNSLIASFAAVGEDLLEASVFGILTMGLAGERAFESLKGHERIGTFRTRLFDWVDVVTNEGAIGEVQVYETSL